MEGNIARGMITQIGPKFDFSVKSIQYFFQTSCSNQFPCPYKLKSCPGYKNVKKSTFGVICYKILLFGSFLRG